MKSKLTLIAGIVVALTLAFGATQAQSIESDVKIIPTKEDGIYKVIYAYETDQPVDVLFFDEKGLITLDHVQAKRIKHGFSKKYDLRSMNKANLWVEVRASNVSVTFKMMPSADKRYLPTLEKTTFNHPLVAVNN